MDLYEKIKYHTRVARKNNDAVRIFIDKNKNKIYHKSYGGLVFRDMVADMNTDEGYNILKYALNNKGNGIEVIFEDLQGAL